MFIDTWEDLKERYADSIWVHSHFTTIRGPIRNNFDPTDPYPDWGSPLRMPDPDKYEVGITSMSGKQTFVETFGEVDYVHFLKDEKREYLIIFRTAFGHGLADFAVVTPRLWRGGPDQKALPGQPAIEGT